MNKKLVVLCSTAIAAAYATGYFASEAQAPDEQPPRHQQYESSISSGADSTNGYRDGIYTGQGKSRHGSIQVTITIQGSEIVDVDISRFKMQYSKRDIIWLPDEVVHNQSSQVTNVSGATSSVQAFEGAVEDALSKAFNL